MARHKVMAIGLDGFDATLAERYMAEGQMPALAELKSAPRVSFSTRAPRAARVCRGSTWPRGYRRKRQAAGGRWISIRLPTRLGRPALNSRRGGPKPIFG